MLKIYEKRFWELMLEKHSIKTIMENEKKKNKSFDLWRNCENTKTIFVFL